MLEAARTLGKGGTPLVFPTARGRQLKDMALSGLLKNLKVAAVPHGFRSSFRDWAAEETDHVRYPVRTLRDSVPRRDDEGVVVRIVVDDQQLPRGGAASHGAGHHTRPNSSRFGASLSVGTTITVADVHGLPAVEAAVVGADGRALDRSAAMRDHQGEADRHPRQLGRPGVRREALDLVDARGDAVPRRYALSMHPVHIAADGKSATVDLTVREKRRSTPRRSCSMPSRTPTPSTTMPTSTACRR